MNTPKIIALLFLLAQMDYRLVGAQALPTKKEAALLLQQAAQATNLSTSDTPPFHLVAVVHYEIGGESADGKYELLSASPDRFREDFRVGSIAETDVALGDKLYIMRNTPTMTLPLWSVRKSIVSSKYFISGLEPKVKRVYSAPDGKNQACVDSSTQFVRRQTCFDLATHKAVSFNANAMSSDSVSMSPVRELKNLSVIELGDFVDMSAKRYPLRIHRQEMDEKIDLKIEKLEQVKSFGDGVFTLTPGANELEWCSKPETKGAIDKPHTVPRVTMEAPGNRFAYYVLVGSDGRVEKWAPLRSGGSFLDDWMKDWLKDARFPVSVCGGKSIEYETVVSPPTHIHFRH
jgi:hypothetical protein